MFGPITRIPLRYSPRSTSTYRWQRLPPPAAYTNMRLADTQAFTEALAHMAHPAHVCRLLFVTLAATLLTGYLAPLFPRHYVLAAAALLLCVLPLLALFRDGILTLRQSLYKAGLLPALLVLSCFAAPLFAHRLGAAVILGVLSVVALAFGGRDTFAFWDAWFSCHHCLRPVHPTLSQTPSAQPNWHYVFAVFVVVALLPVWSPFLGYLGFVGITAFALRNRLRDAKRLDPDFRPTKLVAFAIRVATLPRAYFQSFTPYPGCWDPAKFWRARYTSVAMFLFVSLTLSLSLSAYFPWDTPFFRKAFLITFRETIHTNPTEMELLHTVAPATDWSRFPKSYEAPADALTPDEIEQQRPSVSPEAYLDLVHLYKQQQAQRAGHDRRVEAALAGALNSSPYLWLYIALRGLFRGATVFAYPCVFVCLGTALAPGLFLFTAFFQSLIEASRRSMRLPATALYDAKTNPTTAWERYTEILSTSPHTAADPVDARPVREADHFFMGHESYLGFPILLDASILSQHAYILGGTGFGKTSLGIMPLVMRLIRGQLEPCTPCGSDVQTTPAYVPSPMPPMLIIDLKGDMALLQTVKHEVEAKAGKEGRSLQEAFRLFSCEADHVSHAFNPFDSLDPQATTAEICNVFLDALDLNHGAGYGRGYYTKQSARFLRAILKNDRPPKSFQELYIDMERRRGASGYKEAFELVATVEALTDYYRIAQPVSGKKEPVIHMPDVIRNRQVAYFWLPAAEHSETAKAVACLALYTFYNALRKRVKSGLWREENQPKPRGFLIIDEFQRVAGRNFPNILREARSFGLSIILAHQSAHDLDLPDLDLAPIVHENTRLKLFFAIQDPSERDRFSKMSGQELAIQPSISFQNRHVTETTTYTTANGKVQTSKARPVTDFSESFTPILKPRITVDDIIEVSDYPFDYYMLLGQGAGYTQFGGYPIPVRLTWPMPTDVYQARTNAPWPAPDDLGLSQQSPVNEKTPKEVDAKVDAKLQEALIHIEQRVMQTLGEDPSLQN